jgi:putative sterol carrier protein
MSEVKYSPEQIVEALPKYLVPEKAGATKATIQFDISGDAGGKWWVKIHEGKAETGKGDAPETANLTLIAADGDFVKIMTGEMDGMSAFMSRKLQVKGDMGLAVKLQTLFKRPS